ncbi:restriction endonuclease subunit S [Mycoplasma sp. VS424B]|uniref:restriction endonuclease subunit S n=1 Tax=Mycoplasma sp. VS424B TaxID=3401660 RepID=UPI003AADC562
MQKQKLVPEIRFKGFEEEWNQKVINQTLIPVISTLTMSNVQGKGEILLFDANSIVGYSSYALSSVPYLTIIKDGAGVGRIRKLPGNSAFLGTMTGLIPRNVDIDFIHSLISTLSLEKSFSGSTIPHIYFSDYGKLKIYIPYFSEQQKIGQFFSSIDSLIQSQELKLKKLNEIKQSLLSKMFASKNQKFPEIRFKGFEEEWKTAILDDFIDYERPDKYIEKLPLLEFGRIPVLTANKSFKLGYTESKNYYAKGDCILFDDFTLDSKYVNFPFMVVSSALKILTLKNNQDSLPYYFAILSNNTFESQGHARHYISVVAKTSIKISDNITEKNLIGSFYNYIDSLISSQELKLEKLNNIKQALLEKMFC